MMHRLAFLVLCAASPVLMTSPAYAAITLGFQDLMYAPGDSNGHVDVTITGDPINAYNLQFQITGGAASEVGFTSDALGSYDLTSTFNSSSPNPSYIFAADSLDSIFSLSGTVAGNGTILNVADSTLGGEYVSPSSSLLVRLDFTLTANPAIASGTFDISLNLDPNVSYFATETDGNIGPSNPSFSQAVVLGAPASNVVPEPGTCGMMLAGIVGLVLARRKRHARNGHAEVRSAAQAKVGV